MSKKSLYILRKLIALSSSTTGVIPRSSRLGVLGVGVLEWCSWKEGKVRERRAGRVKLGDTDQRAM